MSFDATGWISVGYLSGKNMVFGYKTNDLLTAVDDSGYFNSVYQQLHKGDIILVSGDLDGTPANIMLTVNSADGAATVTTVAQASVTLSLTQPIQLTTSLAAVGTAETNYLDSMVPSGFTGQITRVTGVVSANGAGSGGTSTVTVSVPTTGAVATLAFAQDYTAGTLVEDTTITAHTLAHDAVITVATDGTGSHTGKANITLEVTLTAA